MIYIKKDIAIKLREKIVELEKHFSNPEREYNTNAEIFKCTEITPLSDSVVLITIQKNTGKKSMALFFYIKNYWIYFFPSDSHELGIFNYLSNKYRINLENHNFDKNFPVETIKIEDWL